MITLVTSITTSKNTRPPIIFMHTNGGCPAPCNGFKPRHSKKNFAILKNFQEIIIPIAGHVDCYCNLTRNTCIYIYIFNFLFAYPLVLWYKQDCGTNSLPLTHESINQDLHSLIRPRLHHYRTICFMDDYTCAD